LIRHGSIGGVLGYVVGCTGLCIAGASWVEYRWQARRRAEHARRLALATRHAAPAGSFAARIDQRIEHYFATYLPDGMDRTDWLAITAGTRTRLRGELVEIYQGRRIGAEGLNWLFSHEAGEAKRRWKQETFYSPAQEFYAAPAVRTGRSAGMIGTVIGGLVVALALLHADPVGGLFSLAVLAVSGYHGTRQWTSIALERRRAAADEAEYKDKDAEWEAAYERWSGNIENIKPTDQEMAEWLDCDKKIMLANALRHYGLKRSDVISYAFLETPGASYKRASVRNGPWRYTQYRILIFLLTEDGIRQAAFDLRTRDGDVEPGERHSYRYNAIACVETSVPTGDYQQTFDLYLVNGRTISFRVVDPITHWLPGETDAEAQSNATQDATGLRNTLRILEGVAADGKEWIVRETQIKDAGQ
jgi:hypothetical protein